jgi:predicted metal-dependent enzyme (double-stranded beta helix superfamily)
VCAQFSDERQILSHVRPLARRAALSKASWLEDRMYRADATQGFGVHLIYEEPDHTVAILALSWLPNRGAPPHDHGTWAVVAGVDGPEKNEFFERADDRTRPGHAQLKKVGEKVCGVGDVLALPKGMIHSVWNDTDAVTLSLHIYGKHINYTVYREDGELITVPFRGLQFLDERDRIRPARWPMARAGCSRTLYPNM